MNVPLEISPKVTFSSEFAGIAHRCIARIGSKTQVGQSIDVEKEVIETITCGYAHAVEPAILGCLLGVLCPHMSLYDFARLCHLFVKIVSV